MNLTIITATEVANIGTLHYTKECVGFSFCDPQPDLHIITFLWLNDIDEFMLSVCNEHNGEMYLLLRYLIKNK